MTTRFLYIAAAAALLSLSRPVSAQFSSMGSDPGRVRWLQVETSHYRLIYPRGLDSLAREYAALLERYRDAEGKSIGFRPGEFQWGKTPVVLHAYTGTSNGAVTWAPKRIDLFTLPAPYDSDPLPWEQQLTVHESRHLAQMQFGYRRKLRILNYLVGEIGPGALSAIFPNQALLEGDAVVAETALTAAGRARTADFLSYFKVAFDHGDYRDWYRWRYGSFRHYAPNYYAVGYLTVAGLRYFYDEPLFMQKYFEAVTAHPFRVGNLQKTVKGISGSSFNFTFSILMDRFHQRWQEEAEAAGPYMPMEQVTFPGRFYTEYSGNTYADGILFAFKSGLTRPKSFVALGQNGRFGREKSLGAFAENTCSAILDTAGHRFYWSETVPDLRWTLKQTSRIRYMSLSDFRRHDLTRRGRFYNPAPFPDGTRLAAAEYPWTGGSAVVILSAADGRVIQRFPAPAGVQAMEPVAYKGYIYVISLAEGGYAIHRIDRLGGWTEILPPSRQKLQNIDGGEDSETGEDYIEFVSDRDGKNELYYHYLRSGKTFQITSTRYGSSRYTRTGDYLYYPSRTADGQMLFRTRLSDLSPREIPYTETHPYRIEDALSAQEKALGAEIPAVYGGPLSAPKPYRKLPHLFHFHSWTPFYFNPDEIESLSLDYSYDEVSLGATGLFQNHLGTASGFVGYSAHKDDYHAGQWRHSLHAKFVYEGLYPVIEATVDFNDRNNLQYNGLDVTTNAYSRLVSSPRLMTSPSLSGSLCAYVPLQFSKGGWLRGLIPQITFSISNDWYNTAVTHLSYTGSAAGLPAVPRFMGAASGRNVPLQRLTAGVRGYLMRPSAASQVYPSAGIGMEIGYSGRPFMEHLFSPSAYAYLYGYLPGIVSEQGLRLTALMQREFGSGIGEGHVSFHPRGFRSSVSTLLSRLYRTQLRLTADYAVPVYAGDISFLSPVLYIKNFLLTPHGDFTVFKGGSLYSAGASLTLEMANLLWLPFDCSWGIDYSFNGGSYFGALRQSGLPHDRHSLRFVFSMDI